MEVSQLVNVNPVIAGSFPFCFAEDHQQFPHFKISNRPSPQVPQPVRVMDVQQVVFNGQVQGGNVRQWLFLPQVELPVDQLWIGFFHVLCRPRRFSLPPVLLPNPWSKHRLRDFHLDLLLLLRSLRFIPNLFYP